MALTAQQLEKVLGYKAFEKYASLQKKILREKLQSSGLTYLQIAVLFSDDASGGMISNLAEEYPYSDLTELIPLGSIIANVNESINPEYGYPPTPIIQNMISRLGPYDETIAAAVTDLLKQHLMIVGVSNVLIRRGPDSVEENYQQIIKVAKQLSRRPASSFFCCLLECCGFFKRPKLSLDLDDELVLLAAHPGENYV